MRKAILRNNITGVEFKVHATTDHPDSHYGHAVWVDENNIAYIEVDSKIPSPIYSVKEIDHE